MKRFAIFLLAGTLAACGQEPADDNAMADTEANPTAAATTQNAELDSKIMAALETCKQVEPTCGEGSPAGYFVFPDVTNIALGVGGGGGDGALVQNGQIVDYYRMGQGSVGLQAGIDAASYVFKMQDAAQLKQYQDDGEWTIGAGTDVTVIQAGATAQAQSDKPEVYVFNSAGLMADASVNAMKIWRTDEIDGSGDTGAMSSSMESTAGD